MYKILSSYLSSFISQNSLFTCSIIPQCMWSNKLQRLITAFVIWEKWSVGIAVSEATRLDTHLIAH